MIRSIYLPLRTGDASVATVMGVEPTGFGESGSLLEKFTMINMSELFPKNNIHSAKLISSVSIRMTTEDWDANIKIGLKFEGSGSVIWTPTYTKAKATSPGTDKISIIYDLIPKLTEMTDGFLGTLIGAWRSNGSGPGIVQIGDDNEVTPNIYYGIMVVGE